MTRTDELRAMLNTVMAQLDRTDQAGTAKARGYLAVLFSEVLDAQALKQARSVDTACLDEIGAILSGNYWDCDTPVLIADIVKRSGREIRPPPDEITEHHGQPVD